MHKILEWIVTDAEQTAQFGERLAGRLGPGSVVALRGPLGAGKTTLTQGIARGLGTSAQVTSPTFVLLQIYDDARLPLYHFDAYRLEGPAQLEEIGAEEFFWGEGVSVIEWAERADSLLPPDRLDIEIELLPEGRKLVVQATGQTSDQMLEGWT